MAASLSIWKEGSKAVQGWSGPILTLHSCLGMGEGSELVTQGVHPVVRYSSPADPGACARGGSHSPTPLQAPHRQVWSPWNSKNPKEEICSEYCPLSEDRAPLPHPTPLALLLSLDRGRGKWPKKREVREVPVQPAPVSTDLRTAVAMESVETPVKDGILYQQHVKFGKVGTQTAGHGQRRESQVPSHRQRRETPA